MFQQMQMDHLSSTSMPGNLRLRLAMVAATPAAEDHGDPAGQLRRVMPTKVAQSSMPRAEGGAYLHRQQVSSQRSF